VQRFSGASVRRVIDRSHACVPEHAHDWPVLSLFVLGAYRNETEIGEAFIAAPSAVFYRAGASHRNTTAAVGFEQIEIEFDPVWLGREWLPGGPVERWLGGSAATRARALARACTTPISEDQLRSALQQFLMSAPEPVHEPAPWMSTITRRLREDPALRINDLARLVKRHPAWLGAAYRSTTGEGLQERAARFRVERAAWLLRETTQRLAEIALEAGFCDQSHMHRSFRRLLGRSPSAVREDQRMFRQAVAPSGPQSAAAKPEPPLAAHCAGALTRRIRTPGGN
jgi:AraC family transcriptional regulator